MDSNTQYLILTIVDHDAKLLQEKVDVSIISYFPSFSQHHKDISTSIQVMFEDFKLYRQCKRKKKNPQSSNKSTLTFSELSLCQRGTKRLTVIKKAVS